MILPTDSRLAKKSEKNWKNRRYISEILEIPNIFGEISRLYLTRACAGISRKILVKYR